MYNPNFTEQFAKNLPLCKAMGMTVRDWQDGAPAVVLPYNEKLIGDPQTGVLHGGGVSVLLDTCCGAEVISHPLNKTGTATINLRIDYMRPAKTGADLYARADVYHVTKTVAFVRGIAWDSDPEKPVAMATGTFTFERKEEGGS